MKRLAFVLLLLTVFSAFNSCSSAKQKSDKNTVVIETKYGDITIKLYDETPKHKENFLKLVDKKFYDGVLFHRVIEHFMIQGGDPDSKSAKTGQPLGNGDVGYTLPAEFNYKKVFHKRGALAAARMSDSVNPKKESSGAQFYIVQGKVLTNQQLDKLEQMKNQQYKNKLMKEKMIENKDLLTKLKNDNKKYYAAMAELQFQVDSAYEASGKRFAFTEEQRKAYTTIGGTPRLDNDYTVFGEVISGMDVVDKIAAVKTDKRDRPIEDIKMKIKRAK